MQGLIDSITEDQVDATVLIVDNASTAETYRDLESIKDSRVHLLRSAQNLGFTGGVNYALKYALEKFSDIPYFFLLNPDAFSSHNLLQNLVEILEAHPDAACVSPQILTLNGSPWYSGAHIDYVQGKVSTSLNIQTDKVAKLYEIDVFSGCAALFDMRKVVEAGMFNESLFMYYDEADLSIRLKKLGYKILYTPLCKLLHDASYTTRKISFFKTYYMTRNKFMVFNETMSLYNKFYFVIHELAFHLKHRRPKNALYHLKGYYDFLKGKKGSHTVIIPK